jgi:hypothetical protein
MKKEGIRGTSFGVIRINSGFNKLIPKGSEANTIQRNYPKVQLSLINWLNGRI